MAANGLTGLIPHLCRKGLEFISGDDKPTFIERIQQKAADIISEEIEWEAPLNIEDVRLFLGSPEVEEIIRQIYSVHLLEIDGQDNLAAIRNEFLTLFTLFTESERENVADSANDLLDSLIQLCEIALRVAIEKGVLSAHEAKSNLRYHLLRDELETIQKNLDHLTAPNKPNIRKFFEFETKYRKQVGSRHENLITPDFDAVRKRPIDEVYVDPNFITTFDKKNGEQEELSIPEFLSVAYRSVILGNPGSGKSTFTLKLCHDLVTHYTERLFAGRQVTPILVVLRDYGAEKKNHKVSITEFIETTANSNYQIPPPPGVFEYMLLNGRAVVIFDGLDELLDTSYRQEISSDIETFCTLYPSVPVIVTSREVGYEQAPLDKNRFEVFHLASFNDDKVNEYVTKWFAVDGDLTPDEQKRKSEGFLEESRFVPDLRSNPLMLALLCNIYRGENYIPKNRPDVYEKCANMLFERWDKGRGLYVPLPFEAHTSVMSTLNCRIKS